MTQLNMEVALGLSFGHLSRIESDHVNPDKETVTKIATVLKLRTCELNYLLGVTVKPASQEEIDAAISEVKPYFEKKGVIAYLLDERWRYVAFSQSFINLFIGREKTNIALQRILGCPSPRVLLDAGSGASNTFSPDSHEQVLKTLLPYYYSQNSFMIGDHFFLDTARLVKNLPKYKQFWTDLEKGQFDTSFIPQDHRIEYFFIDNHTINAQFSREPLMTNSRFEMHDYQFPKKDLERLDKTGML